MFVIWPSQTSLSFNKPLAPFCGTTSKIRACAFQSKDTPRDTLTAHVTWTRRQAARVTDRSRMFGGAEHNHRGPEGLRFFDTTRLLKSIREFQIHLRFLSFPTYPSPVGTSQPACLLGKMRFSRLQSPKAAASLTKPNFRTKPQFSSPCGD